MLRKFGHALVIFALIGALGGHWAVLQTVAWTNMLATNLRTGSFEEAVTKTFDGQHPCKLCKAISAGKKSEKKSNFQPLTKKLEFVTERLTFVFASPESYWMQVEFLPAFACQQHPPLLPPPRSVQG